MKSNGGLKMLTEKLEKLRQKGVYVGVPAEQNPDVENSDAKNSDTKKSRRFNMAALAAVLEFGNEHIPSRPFLRQTLEKNAEKYTALFAENFKAGMSIDLIYKQLAMIAQGDVQENMVNGNWVANAPITIKRKKSSKPLIDTGRLRQSIIGVVR